MKKVSSLLLLCVFSFIAKPALAEAPGAWITALPQKAVTAQVSDEVWATIPRAGEDMAEVGVYKVDSVEGNTATLIDKIGTKYPGVPGALIHALGDATTLKADDAAQGHAWGASKVIGRVKTSEAGMVTLRYQFGTGFTEKMMEQSQPLVTGVAPMAWVAYDNSGSWYKGLVVALEGGKAWISTDSGHIIMQDMPKLKALAIGQPMFKEGDVVKAYSWGFGYLPGTIVKVVEPGMVYSVKLAGKPEVKDYSFANIVSKI
jgi:hypothetical protein